MGGYPNFAMARPADLPSRVAVLETNEWHSWRQHGLTAELLDRQSEQYDQRFEELEAWKRSREEEEARKRSLFELAKHLPKIWRMAVASICVAASIIMALTGVDKDSKAAKALEHGKALLQVLKQAEQQAQSAGEEAQ